MKRISHFFQKHIVSWLLLALEVILLSLKLAKVIPWPWWEVLIPLYAIALWWIVMFSIGMVLTKRDEKKEGKQDEK